MAIWDHNGDTLAAILMSAFFADEGKERFMRCQYESVSRIFIRFHFVFERFSQDSSKGRGVGVQTPFLRR